MYSVERLLGGEKRERAGMESPLEHLVACHGRIEDRLNVLERAAAAFQDKPEEALAAAESCFRYFDTSGLLHTRDEEESVFPRVRGRLTEDEVQYLESLEQQHREADELYRALKEDPCDPEAVERFCAHYRRHIASENERLIEAARRVLGDAELAEIAGEMRRRRGL